MDFTLYWFMFPLAIGIATTAMLSGIAGAAMFMPVFLLLFPILGIEYELASPVVSIAAALITSTFGFASGFAGYYTKGLIDFEQARPFLVMAIPPAILGALFCPFIPADGIRFFYGLLMIALALGLGYHPKKKGALMATPSFQKEKKSQFARNGDQYHYALFSPRLLPTALGGFLTGLLSTGIGEVTIPQLVKKGKLPVAVAAATSVTVVIGTFIFAAGTHTVGLISSGGLQAIPWNLICYTVPGVIIGGQIGPRLQGRFSREVMVNGIAVVFLLIGVAMVAAVVAAWFGN